MTATSGASGSAAVTCLARSAAPVPTTPCVTIRTGRCSAAATPRASTTPGTSSAVAQP